MLSLFRALVPRQRAIDPPADDLDALERDGAAVRDDWAAVWRDLDRALPAGGVEFKVPAARAKKVTLAELVEDYIVERARADALASTQLLVGGTSAPGIAIHSDGTLTMRDAAGKVMIYPPVDEKAQGWCSRCGLSIGGTIGGPWWHLAITDDAERACADARAYAVWAE